MNLRTFTYSFNLHLCEMPSYACGCRLIVHDLIGWYSMLLHCDEFIEQMVIIWFLSSWYTFGSSLTKSMFHDNSSSVIGTFSRVWISQSCLFILKGLNIHTNVSLRSFILHKLIMRIRVECEVLSWPSLFVLKL